MIGQDVPERRIRVVRFQSEQQHPLRMRVREAQRFAEPDFDHGFVVEVVIGREDGE